MYHVVFLVKRRPDMTPNEFARYWIELHTPRTAPKVGAPPFDGFAILSFDDEAAYPRAIASPEFSAAIGDAPNFQDTDGTTSFIAAAHVIV